ncbi:uncharacterized protein N7459_002254 [Penicillium hispanicum]|uniref:uncharacterized protein n=1 Tax=Penicillium hispanicum TaxID=1080232 RepID=UPI00253FC36A|nr:uncharacterized protein N7459_002254 [Penicillium hispanicum]KAJ5591885.1 hypothetical protein N7459_002254 [Penicillium hispanicum]
MAPRGVMRRFGSKAKLHFTRADSIPVILAEPPQVNLPHVDTQLNMHQFNGYFEDGSMPAEGLTGRSCSVTFPIPDADRCRHLRVDSNTSPSQPSHPSVSPHSNNGEAPTEWSAVGHAAATGKSGRVIHNLQEEIARLTRECSLYRSRAEETQRSNEALKIQVQNVNERLRNLEQVNETNLNSITRKDRKLEELRVELQNERVKRQEAEADASKTNDTMREERENHHREQARSQEIAKHHETQYEVFASTSKRERADLAKRVKALWTELQSMADAQKTQSVCTERLDVIADQKNREVAILKDAHDKLMSSHADYKKIKDDELRGTIERAHANNEMIDAAIASLKETEAQMKWAIQLNKNTAKD